MAKKFKVMASNAKEPDGKCIPKSMRKSVESACGKKKAVKASDSESKFRIDIFKKDNPDALVKREFKMFKSEDEAKKYGESVANGNIVNVMKVNAGCTKKSVKSGKVLFPWAMVGRFADGYTCEVSGDSEADCIEKLGNMQDKHGELEYYSGVDDDDYDADGRRIYSSRTKKFGVKASKDAKKRVAAAKGAKQEYISKEFVNLANDPYLQTAYDSNNLTVSLINGDTILIIAEGPNRTEIERKAKAVAKKIYPQYELYGDTKRYKDVPRDDIKSACKTKKTVKASAAAKKRKAIKASGITDDIVIYFNGDNVYQGSIYDMADAIENLCYDDEVNAKFQEWCNQFGDPFDFDGSPIDTARVFTDIIIHEAEESPVSEDGQSEFYEDGDGILDFEIFYADDIYGAKSIKCAQGSYSDFDEDMPFYVAQYYDTKFRDTAESASFDDMGEAVDYAHECLGKGPTSIEHYSVGRVDIDPDEYWGNFDGEFWCTPELAEWRDEVWKSMGIGASKDVKCNDGIAPDDYDNVEDLVPEAYALSGGEDDDMLEYVDDYIATEGCPATVNFVTYNTPNDWSVDVSKYGEAVVSDFIWYLEEVASELSDKFYDYPSYEDDTTRNAFKGTKYEEGGKYATFYGDDALVANDYEFQFYPAQNQWSAPQIEFGTDELKLIGFTDDEIDKLMQIYEDYKTAWIENCKYINAHIGEFLADLESNVNASTNIKAGITVGEDSRFDFSNPIYELDDYVKAIADGVVNQIQGITYDISKETIAFFDEDNNVVFVQPIGGIIPEPDDLETDIYELSSAIKSEMDSAYGRENWEQDEDNSDYASRAVELSEDIGEVDIDDLEPITGDDVDYGYGYDSNGDPIDESTVEELYRIAEYEILPKSELAKIDEYVSIDEDSWDFYMSSPHVTEKFYIHFKLTEKDINFNDYTLPDGKMFPDFNYYTAVLDFDIYAENGEITSVILEDKKIYRPDGAFDDYDVKQFDDLYNVEALINYVEHLAADTVKDIYNGTTNL